MAQNLGDGCQYIFDVAHIPTLHQLTEGVEQCQQALTGQLLVCLRPVGGQVWQDNRLNQRRLIGMVVEKRRGLPEIYGTAPIVVPRVAGIDDSMPVGQLMPVAKIIKHRWLTVKARQRGDHIVRCQVGFIEHQQRRVIAIGSPLQQWSWLKARTMIIVLADQLLTTKQCLPIRTELNDHAVLVTGFFGHRPGHKGLADAGFALQKNCRVLANAISQSAQAPLLTQRDVTLAGHQRLYQTDARQR